MPKKVLIFIIIFIICYEIYLIYSEQGIKKKLKKELNEELNDRTNEELNDRSNEELNEDHSNKINNKYIENFKYPKIVPNENKLFSFISNDKEESQLAFKDDNELIEDINPNMFGKPSEYERNNIIIWDMIDPKPWNKVIYKYNEKYPFYFYIKVKIPTLNDYNNWKNIISNLDFDPRTGEIIIPSEDEEGALSLANLILTNFKGDLSLEDIIKKNLIDISINKARKYNVVKNKLIEQIMINLNNKPKEEFINTQTFTTDLAQVDKNKYDEYSAYEGVEYSFF